MGGINHQPCNAFLAESTRCSRHLSLSRSHFELSNVELEDVLLRELERHQGGSVSPIKHHLQLSLDNLTSLTRALDGLRRKMDELCYKDLPSLSTINLDCVGEKLAGAKLVNLNSWKKMSRMMKGSTFYANVGHFETEVDELKHLTGNLLKAVSGLEGRAQAGELNLVVEKNETGNLKVSFAQLYVAWANFQQDFLASALVSTEVWYAHSKVGSLVQLAEKDGVLSATST